MGVAAAVYCFKDGPVHGNRVVMKTDLDTYGDEAVEGTAALAGKDVTADSWGRLWLVKSHCFPTMDRLLACLDTAAIDFGIAAAVLKAAGQLTWLSGQAVLLGMFT